MFCRRHHHHAHHGHGPGSILWAVALGIPLFFLWNALAPIYAPGLPPLYQHLPFWHVLGLCATGAILRTVLLP